jgi:hypothetical protein
MKMALLWKNAKILLMKGKKDMLITDDDGEMAPLQQNQSIRNYSHCLVWPKNDAMY